MNFPLLPVNQVLLLLFDIHGFCLMLALVIPQIETSFVFSLKFRIRIVPGVSEGLKKSKTFWVNALVESRAGQDTGSCMPPTLEMSYHK